MGVEHVYRVAQSGWLHCHGSTLQEVEAWPRLEHSALVVVDLDEVHSDVWRFEGKAEYAAALIEKRVRTQGLVDGNAHIVVHRLVKLPGGFQAFFSAVPLEVWQRLIQWAAEQPDHCLIMLAPGLLCHGVGNGKARYGLSQRRLMGFVQSEAGMAYGDTHVLGSGMGGMSSAAQMMVANQRSSLNGMDSGGAQFAVLWSSEPSDVESCATALRSALGTDVQALPAQEFAWAEERVQTVLPTLAPKAAGSHAVNEGLEKLAWRAERWVVPVAAITLVVGLVLGTVGVLVGQMADQQQLAGRAQRDELQSLQQRIQSVSEVQAPQRLLPVADFARALDEGARHDPVAFMALLKEASGKDIRIQRVRLQAATGLAKQRYFRVDGATQPGATAAVTRWVTHMTMAGWTLKAVDPESSGTGAFSYELVARAVPEGNVKP